MLGANVGKYAMHSASGYCWRKKSGFFYFVHSASNFNLLVSAALYHFFWVPFHYTRKTYDLSKMTFGKIPTLLELRKVTRNLCLGLWDKTLQHLSNLM